MRFKQLGLIVMLALVVGCASKPYQGTDIADAGFLQRAKIQEQEGLVVRQQGRGVFVSERPKRRRAREWRPLIRKSVDELLVQAWTLGVSTDDVIDELRERASRLAGRSGEEDE